MSTCFAYSFEAKSIQEYVLAGNRLRHVVGASELLESLWSTQLDDVLKALGIEDEVEFSRRAGGAFTALHSDETVLKRLQALWTLIVQQAAPGLAYVQAIAQGSDAYDAADQLRQKLDAARNVHNVPVPQAGPLIARSPRTGAPAVARAGPDRELIDLAAQRKRKFEKGGGLRDKFTDDEMGSLQWPVDLNPEEQESDEERDEERGSDVFPFLQGNRYVGIVHADGNGLGQLLMNMRSELERTGRRREYVDVFSRFSRALDEATRAAARRAVREVLAPHVRDNVVPARPIVLGGDDLTIIVRGDLAVPFTRVFLEAFEEETEKEITRLGDMPLRGAKKLSACAGIAFIKSSQPFHLAYALAESLCKFAKSGSKREIAKGALPPSSLAFHRVTTSMIDEYSDIVARELTLRQVDKDGKVTESHRLTLQPYACGGVTQTHLPRLDDVMKLKAWLDEDAVSRGPLRKILSAMTQDPAEADKRYQRWREVSRDPEKAGGSDTGKRDAGAVLAAFDECMKQVFPTAMNSEESLFAPVGGDPSTVLATPLGDVLALQAVEKEHHD